MKIVQLIQWAYDRPVSGADLRNEAVARSLRQLGSLRQIATEPQDFASNGAFHGDVLQHDPDLVVVEGVGLLEQAVALRQSRPDLRIVMDFHNVESALLREQDRARLPRGIGWFGAPLLWGNRWRVAKNRDRAALKLADATWVCSDQDARLAMDLAREPANLHVVPNSVPPWCFETDAGETQTTRALDAPRILYVGHLGYRPNKRAVRYLAQLILPRLRRHFPTTEICIAGRAPNARFRRFLGRFAGVNLCADPARLGPLYAGANMVVLPLFQGGGSRIKVLEALAVGCPIVATDKAVEGLDLVAGKHYLRAETPQEFTTQIQMLIDEPNRAQGLAEAGRAFIQAHHGDGALDHAIAQALVQSWPDLSL